MPDPLTKLLASLRRSLQGRPMVQRRELLVRAGAWRWSRATTKRIVLRVRSRPGRWHPQWFLYPGENEWDCELSWPRAPCEQPGGSSDWRLARTKLRPKRRGSQALPKPMEAWSASSYRFSQVPGGRNCGASWCAATAARRPDGTLSSLLSRLPRPAICTSSNNDLQADRMLESGSRGVLLA